MFGIGILLAACGIFLLVYGGLLFRFALAVGFFVLGFSLTSWLFSSQPDMIRLLVSFVAGGVLAVVGYALVRMMLHIAGGLLGAVLVLLILSLLPFSMPSFLSVLIIIAGAGVVGFFGNRLGDWVIILATTLTGAYAVIFGLTAHVPGGSRSGRQLHIGVCALYRSGVRRLFDRLRRWCAGTIPDPHRAWTVRQQLSTC